MKLPIMNGPVALLLLLASIAFLGMECCSYIIFPVWHGNVTNLGVSQCEANACLGFTYDNGRHGYAVDGSLVIKFSNKQLPWLWCEVSRTGRGECLAGKEGK